MDLKEGRSRTSRRTAPVILMAGALVAGALAAGILPRAEAQTQTPSPTPVQISPAVPAEGDALTVSADVLAPGDSVGGIVDIEGSRIVLYVSAPLVSPQPPPTLQHLVWPLPALQAGSYHISVSLVGNPELGFTVQPRATTMGLLNGRFVVTVDAQQPGASPAAVTLSDASGYFTYFNAEDVELTVKAVDGRPVNGHFWIFIASMTNTPFTVTVTDTSVQGCVAAANCPTRTYTNAANTNQNFLDVNAF